MAATSSNDEFVYVPGLAMERVSEKLIGERPVLSQVHKTWKGEQAKEAGPPCRFVFASDLHNNYRKWAAQCSGQEDPVRLAKAVALLPEGDFFVITGDWTENGSEREVTLFLRFLELCVAARKYKHIVCIAGNHDLSFDSSRPTFFNPSLKHLFLQRLAEFGNVHYLESSSVTLLGFNFYGSPWINRSWVDLSFS